MVGNLSRVIARPRRKKEKKRSERTASEDNGEVKIFALPAKR